jgi:hypothetical protein
VIRVPALSLVLLALLAVHPLHASASIEPLSAPVRAELKQAGVWHKGCPVALSGLRLLTVTYHGMDKRSHTGQLVVNKDAAAPLEKVFRRLNELHFPIHHMALDDAYGPKRSRPADNDVSGSFECREAVPSPCSGGTGTGSWSNHAFGKAVDLNPTENPYVGCGQSHDPAGRKFFNRSKHRRGMVTAAVIQAFRSVGWGWGGSWAGSTKDYMHFSFNGH